ncbi:hypothetical protein ACFFIX_19645 [Metabacillus herbersteinensis]|uniref:Uncharacterized protein n=1 Tax=Metabacillus herbersteinensis TaxID=283816 RepID=A0ABV6GKE5_9BACI
METKLYENKLRVLEVFQKARDLLGVDYISNHSIPAMNGIHYVCELLLEMETSKEYEEVYTLLVSLANKDNLEDGDPDFIYFVKKTAHELIEELMDNSSDYLQN